MAAYRAFGSSVEAVSYRLVLPPAARRFVCFFNFLGWWHWSIGFHIDVRHPHIDLHVLFGFLRLGWFRSPTIDTPRTFGYDGWKR